MANGKSLHMMMEEDDAAKADEPARRRLAVNATEEQRTAINRAIDLYDARYRDDALATHESRAASLAAIAAAWRAMERDAMRQETVDD